MNILLIHGTWGSGGALVELVGQFEQRGFTVYSPSLRHHGTPQDIDIWTSAQQVSKTGLLDYVADLVALVETMDSPPIIAGHSLGGLLAQLVAARVPNRGLILFGTAPASGMFNIDPMPTLIWGRYIPQWLAGKPMYPCNTKVWDKWVCNALPSELSAEWYGSLCAESGTAYREVVFWWADRKRAAKVDYDAITTPVLVIAGSKDNVTVPRVNRKTAAKYGERGTYVELEGSDHMMTAGPYLPQTLAAIDAWLDRHALMPV